MGAPRSHEAPTRRHRDRPGRRARPVLRMHPYRRRASGCTPRRHGRAGCRTARAPVRGIRREPSISRSSRRSTSFLIAGDLFDSNVQPRRSAERVAAELKRLVDARIRTVLIPGTHDVYDRASIYRAYDLAAMAGSTIDYDLVTVLRPGPSRTSTCRPATSSSTAACFATKRAPAARWTGFTARRPEGRATWHDRHGPRRRSPSPARPIATRSSSRPTRSPRSGLDYLALGHWHSAQVRQGRHGHLCLRRRPGGRRPRPGRRRQGAPRESRRDGRHATVTVEERMVGATTFEKLELDASGDQPASPPSSRRSPAKADPDLVLDVRIVGVRPDELDIHADEVETALSRSFLKVRVRDVSRRPLTEGTLAVARHDRRRVHPRPRGPDRAWRPDPAQRRRHGQGRRTARRPSPRPAAAGRSRGLAVRITPPARREPPPLSRARYRPVAGPDDHPRPQRGRQVHDPACHRAGPHPPGHERGRRPRVPSTLGCRRRRPDRGFDRVRPGRGGRLADRDAREDIRRREGHRGPPLRRAGDLGPALADQVVAELTGIPTEGFFRSTGSIRHLELAGLARDEASLRDRLQASISGADRGTSHARRKLDRAVHDLTTKGDKNPGRLKVAEQAVAQAAASVEQGDLALAQLERDRDSLSAARERRAEAETSLAERRALLEKARQAERLMAERDAAKERYERYRQAVEVSDEVAALGSSHPSPNALPVLRQVVDRLRTRRQAPPRAPRRSCRTRWTSSSTSLQSPLAAPVAVVHPAGHRRRPHRGPGLRSLTRWTYCPSGQPR